ncbi:MAG: hypothetical protein ACYCXN_15710 [Acidimicrobiales bacterium]
MKLRYIRGGDVLHDDEDVVVRGGELDPIVLRRDAQRNHEIYGVYAISVFAVRDITLDEMAQHAPLVRFDRLTLVKAGVIQAAGLKLEATGRNPRHFDISFDQLDDGIERLCHCDHVVVDNPYHED